MAMENGPETNAAATSETIMSIQAALLQPSSIEELESLQIALSKKIENEKATKQYAKVLESERMLKEKVASLEGEVVELRMKIEELEAAKEKTNRGVGRATQTDPETCPCQPQLKLLQAEVQELKSKLRSKDTTIRGLEKDKSLKESLVQVGVDVRIGCLERTKEGFLDDYTSDPIKIEKRNSAAHEGNWKADAALMILGYLSEDSLNHGDASKMFWNNVYKIGHVRLEQEIYTPINCIKAINHHFTMMGAIMPEGREAQIIIRDTKSFTNQILQKWVRTENKGDPEVRSSFQQDEEIYNSLVRLSKLKDRAVRLARKMNGKNRV